MINFEFSQLYPEEENNFLNSWQIWTKQILQEAKYINKSPALLKFLTENCGEWDEAIGALFTLLHLIPPTAQGKAKRNRCNIEDAKTRLEGTPLQSILDTWKGDVKQPNLLCLGSDKNSLDNFFIICDRLLLPLAARNSTEAIDSLFKSHYVFGTEYDVSLRGLWKFIQVYIFKLDPEEPNLPMKVKQVFNQLNRGINQPQKNV
ncbi:uncharacterized protein LOC118436708 [Folsomia candida]|nr:uncharacterized protein LOC118436708 [Folsomia candida]